ncbi:MAG: Xaa-Pro peptidase family protein, partial [Armatimonadota bacterium]|nr:Xaa-Pro peptidase family protein [Armatimonadota bacterium]
HENGLDTLILTPGASMRYLTGFSEPGSRFLALIVPDDQPWLFVTPALNAEQARENPAGITDIRLWEDVHGWEPLLAQLAKDLMLDIGIVGLDDDMPARFVLKLQELMPTALLKSAGAALAPLRAFKDTQELATMQRAADATDELIAVAQGACRVGVSELKVSLAIQQAIALGGHELSFEPIIGAGPNGAFPHHHTGKTKVKPGDTVILDFGAMVDGYHGDITRTVSVGPPSDEAQRIYDIVYRAYRAGVSAVQPGATAHDVDTAARQVIADAEFGDFFIHRTGHGIGLDDHEPPFMLAGNYTKLQPGHCFSVEPGIYLPGRFGVRLENIVTVAEDGTARVLNQAISPEIVAV